MQAQLHKFLSNGVKLYYRILKLHKNSLPGKIRKLGDIYVKQQFRYHHSNPTLHYYRQFYNKWLEYEKQLSTKGLHQISKPMSEHEEKLLNNDQKQALHTLKQSIQKKQILK